MNKIYNKFLPFLLILTLVLSACSGNNPDTNESESEESGYDWGTLAPETEKDDGIYTYSFDKYALSAAFRDTQSDDFIGYYVYLVNTVEAHGSGITIPSEYKETLVTALLQCYPCSALLSKIAAEDFTVESEAIEGEEPIVQSYSNIILEYTYDEETHKTKTEEFYNSCAKILSENITSDMSETEKALALYTWCAKNIVDYSSKKITVFDAIYSRGEALAGTEDVYSISGITHSGTLQYLALQARLEATLVSSKIRTSKRAFCMIKLNGSNYLFDPACECSDTSGMGLMFFGMTEEDRISEGFSGEYCFSELIAEKVARSNIMVASPDYALNCHNTGFSALRDCDYYTVSSGVLTISHKTTDEEEKMSI